MQPAEGLSKNTRVQCFGVRITSREASSSVVVLFTMSIVFLPHITVSIVFLVWFGSKNRVTYGKSASSITREPFVSSHASNRSAQGAHRSSCAHACTAAGVLRHQGRGDVAAVASPDDRYDLGRLRRNGDPGKELLNMALLFSNFSLNFITSSTNFSPKPSKTIAFLL